MGKRYYRCSVCRAKLPDNSLYCSATCVRIALGKVSVDAIREALEKRQAKPVALSATIEYRTLLNAIKRCYNPRDKYYKFYGGRGITVYAAWRRCPKEFIDYIGKRPSSKHSIDRIDNDGNYEPGNVRWATATMQARNTSRVIMDIEKARLIRKLFEQGVKRKDIMSMFNINRHMISNILLNRTWNEEEVEGAKQ